LLKKFLYKSKDEVCSAPLGHRRVIISRALVFLFHDATDPICDVACDQYDSRYTVTFLARGHMVAFGRFNMV